jgi:hypothetical protein
VATTYQVNSGSNAGLSGWNNDPDAPGTNLSNIVNSLGGASTFGYSSSSWDGAFTNGVGHVDLPAAVGSSYLMWWASGRSVSFTNLTAVSGAYTLTIYSTAPGSVNVNWTCAGNTQALARGGKVTWTGLTPSSGTISATSASTSSGSDATISAAILVFDSTITGTSAVTLAALTSTGTARSGAAGSAAVTLATSTSVASGSGDLNAVTGAPANTLGTLVSAATGHVTIAGPSAVTLAALTSTTTGRVTIAGPSAVTLAALTSTASGKRGASGSAAVTLATSTSGGVGFIPAAGSAASTLASATSAGRAGFHLAGSGRGMATYDFQAGTVPSEFVWAGTTATPGTIVSKPDAVGGMTLALRFPDINDSQESYFELAVWATATNNQFKVRYASDSEDGYDYFRLYIDGVMVAEVSGEASPWLEYSATLIPGDYTMKFRFSKDSSVSDGEDTAWISTLTYPYGEFVITGIGLSTLQRLTSAGAGAVSPRRVRRVALNGSTQARNATA